ncbi:MAG: OmpA family protein [Desulfovibrionaceae bacterium]|nr:OmpA family protein [Desulfovibrionaceae bacterium]
MPRRKQKKAGETSAAWLVTFADLMTLLIVFFVLLLSMSTMDTTVLTRISARFASASPIALSGPGRIPERIQLIVRLLKDPFNVLEKRKRLKDLLFPLDVLPRELAHSDLEKNLEVLAHPEGVVVVLTEGLLFAEGTHNLDPVGKKLLDALTPVIHAVNADINISGHSDPGTEKTRDAYELSFMRAASVLDYFLQAKLPPDRFSLSGYGPDRPMFADGDPENGRKNRRVEILLKTTSRISSFI